MHMLPNTRTMSAPYYLGLGDTTNAAIGAGAAGAQLGLTLATTTAAIPVAGAIIAAGIAITALVENLIANSGCGPTCVASSNFANQVGQAMTNNLNAYLSSPRTTADQAAALGNYDYLKAQLIQLCSNPALGDAGVRCITDRFNGACKWQSTPGAWARRADGSSYWVEPGAAGSGSTCWNYDVGMRDPIATDPDVQANTALIGDGSVGGFVDSAAASIGVSATTLLLLAAAGVLLLSASSPTPSRGRRYA